MADSPRHIALFRDPLDEWDDDDGLCPQCGGSGGGPDPALWCSHCKGTGEIRREREDEPDE